MSRPKRFGRDSNLASDGTINDVYIYQYFMHWQVHHTCPCYRLGLASMYMKRFTHEKNVQFLFVNYICFVTFFLLYFHGIEKIELKIIPTNLQFIWRCSHLAKLWVDASLTTPSLDNRERYTFEQSLPVVE